MRKFKDEAVSRLHSRLVEEEREMLNDAAAFEAATQRAGDDAEGADEDREPNEAGIASAV